MRKNLFLTLVLFVAAIATANAQWNQYLNSEGLVGSVDATTNCEIIVTDVITPTTPIEGLRITIVDTKAPELYAGKTMAAFGEIQLVDGDNNFVAFTPTSNSIQVGGEDGGGMAALTDGDYSTYYHSYWGGSGTAQAEGEYVYIDLAFEAPISSFRLKLVGRTGRDKFTPTKVMFTPMGEKFEGAADEIPDGELLGGAYTFGSKITSLSELLSAEYVTMLGDRYEGEYGDNKGENAFKGDCFYAGVGATAADRLLYTETPTARFAAQFIPTGDGDDTYYLYWPELKVYMARNSIAAGNNQNDMQNWANTASAAKLKIHDKGNGEFQLSYATVIRSEDGTETAATGWVLADPRERALKVVGDLSKADLESSSPKFPDGQYKLPSTLKFMFYNSTWSEATYVGKATLAPALFDATIDASSYGGKQLVDDALAAQIPVGSPYALLTKAIDDAETALENNVTSLDAQTHIANLHTAQAWYVYSLCYQKIYDLTMYQQQLQADGLLLEAGAEPVAGKYTMESWNAIIQPLITRFMNVHLYKIPSSPTPYDSCYADAIADVKAVPAAIERFEAGMINITSFPVLYNAENGDLPGENISGRQVWQSPTMRPSLNAIEGFRVTFLKSVITGGNAGATVNKEKYNPIALGEMIVFDGDGNKLNITADMLSTNAQEHNEGPLSGLVDGTYDVNGNITDFGTFYHSPWSSNYTWDPEGYIYFDVKLPANISAFSFKIYDRGRGCFYPTELYVGPYGEEYDPIAGSPNTYEASRGAQITSADDIKEGEVYLIQGIINTNPNTEAVATAAEPNWYSGRTIYHNSAIRAECAYFLTKNADGTFNIFSLKESQYWTAGGELTAIAANAGKFHIVPSTNPDFAGQNTMVIYSDIENPEPVWLGTGKGVIKASDNDSIVFADSLEVTRPYEVLMDWGPGYGVHSRPCIDFQPGIDAAWYGESNAAAINSLTPAHKAASAYGDYLHFNKTSGEGEWKIYKLTMNTPNYYWSTAILNFYNNMPMSIGENPGQLKDAGTILEDREAVQKVVDNKESEEVAAAANKKLLESIGLIMSADDVRNPIVSGNEYILEAALKGYNRLKAMYIDPDFKNNGGTSEPLRWGSKPAEDAEATAWDPFIFKLETPDNIDELIEDGKIKEEQRNSVFTIMNVSTGDYLYEDILEEDKDVEFASRYIFNRGTDDIYTIAPIGKNPLHTEGHGGGAGSGGRICLYSGEPNEDSASAWRIINASSLVTSINDVVVEGKNVADDVIYDLFGRRVLNPVKNVIYIKNGEKIIIK